MYINRVTAEELKNRPDQFCETINRVIDIVNKLEKD